jgi:catechol 2,3-dioxygenase-like lactoylglutathione lyase family enzyme
MATLPNPALNFILLYVADPLKSADLYAKILGVEAVDKAPTFSMFVLPNGLKVGLWAKDDVQPPANAPGGIEVCLTEQNEAAVSSRAETLRGLGLKIAQEPTNMDFGFTFVAIDPDGHRLRFFVPRG